MGSKVPPTSEQIQKAKNLLWEYVDDNNKELLILKANSNCMEDNGFEIDKINLSYEYKNSYPLCKSN